MPTDNSPLTLSDLARAVAASWRLVAVGAVVGVLAGLAIQVWLPQTYTATAAVRVDATGVDPLASTSPTVDLATEERIATSRPIAGSLDVAAHAVSGSRVLEISCTSGSAASAVRGARQVAAAYLADRHRRALARAGDVRREIQGQLDALPGLPAAVVTALRTDLQRASRLRTDGGEVIDQATAPHRGNRPGAALTLSAGGLLGLFLAMPLAAAAPRRRTELVVVDAPDADATRLREGMASLADHVLVVRRTASELELAERWCRRLRSVGIPATVVHSDADLSPSRGGPAS